jgi:outer membrane protein OmpU
MNNLRKIGLTALAGSLATFSVNAADMSVSGAASISFDDTNRGKATKGNGFYMGDSVKFNASGETEGGVGVAVYYEMDGGVLDDYNVKLSGDFGTVTFDGHGGSSAMGAMDDKMPNAYEEAWDIIDTDGTDATGSPTVINGGGGNNMWIYDSPSYGGATLKIAYQNDGGAAAVEESYTDFSLTFVPEAIDGLTLGYAASDNQEGVSIDANESTMYATYATGGFTFGLQSSDRDHTTANSDQESIAYGITYAINDDLSVGYSYHELETEVTTDSDQESIGVSASYTMGGMTLAGAMNEVNNIAGTASRDYEGYEFTLSFAF